MASDFEKYLGKEAEDLLSHKCVLSRDMLHLPGPDFVDRVILSSDRSPAVLRNLQHLFDHGRLGGTGYLSIFPFDHGVEHGAGADFSPNPVYFDPENVLKLALEGGCNAVASTLGILGSVARKYVHHVPFIVKINHNELLSYPNTYDQILFASVDQAFNMGAVGVGATIYFGSPESKRQIQEISRAFGYAHEMGLVTVLWAYLRNEEFRTKAKNYEEAADLTGQANYLGVTIEADIVKQKQATTNGGFVDLKFGKTSEKVYTELTTEHPIDLVRYQVLNCFMGRAGLINSGGPSRGNDFADAARIAIINKRAGGMGVISGRKAFERPMEEGVKLLHLIQDVYLDTTITVA
jgi:class I fructose-bisphosphate aldolase